MIESGSIERSLKRRLKQAPAAAKRTTVHRVGEPPEVRPLIESFPPDFREAHSGRVLLRGGDTEYTYRVGGVRKRLVRVATVRDEFGPDYDTIAPRPGQEIVNGLSDKIDSPRRYVRSQKKSKGGGKQRGTVIR